MKERLRGKEEERRGQRGMRGRDREWRERRGREGDSVEQRSCCSVRGVGQVRRRHLLLFVSAATLCFLLLLLLLLSESFSCCTTLGCFSLLGVGGRLMAVATGWSRCQHHINFS